MSKIIWGISALFHDAGVSVIRDGELVFGAHAERYSGIKHDKHINRDILREAIRYGHPDAVAWYENPWKKRLRQIISTEILYQKFLKHPYSFMNFTFYE